MWLSVRPTNKRKCLYLRVLVRMCLRQLVTAAHELRDLNFGGLESLNQIKRFEFLSLFLLTWRTK
jgi:hypothetical protein